MKIVRVLIVDDSPLFRETASKLLSADSNIEVISTASDAYEARDKIIELKPDVMVLDVELPKMNGIVFLKKLIPQFAMPVVICSSNPANTFEALEAGAVDFVTKPVITSSDELREFGEELCMRVKVAVNAKVICAGKITYPVRKYAFNPAAHVNDAKLIAIGGSTGATEALPTILQGMDSGIPPIVVVMHMPESFTKMYAQRLNAIYKLNIVEAQSGMYLKKGMVVIAAGKRHLKVFKDKTGYFITSEPGKKVSGHCPSVDVLFESVAACAGDQAIGIILTGMGSDGAKGLNAIRRAGGYTIGQDEDSCLVYGMPAVAQNIGAVMKQSSLENIPDEIYARLKAAEDGSIKQLQ